MEFDTDKLDEVVLALLYLNAFQERYGAIRAWKGFDWDTLDRLHEQGFISSPRSKAKSVVMTEEGFERGRQLFDAYFGRSGE